MDSLTTAALVADCNRRLRGARINKIFQPSGEELEFRLWTGSETLCLYLLSRPQQASFYLTGRSFPHPFTPPRFCQLLRSRLSRLLSFEQYGGDRLVRIHFTGKKDDRYQLLLDLRPRPNLILLDAKDRIIDLLRRGRAGERPGDTYVWPPQERMLLSAESLSPVPSTATEAGAFQKWLLSEVAPMSSLAAEDLAACVARGEAANDVLKRFCHDLVAGKWCVQRVSSKSLPVLQVLPLYGLSAEVLATYASVSEALDAGDWVVSGGGLKKELAGIAKTAMKKLRKRLARIEEDYAGLDDLEVLRHQGNLLLTNLYQVRRGMTEIVVEDFTTEPPVLVTIPLDPRLLPQENADRIFKKARKRQRGEAHYLRRLQETRQEIDWLEAMMLACEETDDAVELDALKKQLAAAGYLKLREEPAQRQVKTATAQPLEATSPSGYALTWGRNPRQNDWISRELASPDDLWFHAHNLPGCHLLLRRAGRVDEIPQEDILYAASLAAGYSRGRHDSRVEVMVTEAKQVRKPKGARPGLVTVKQYRTVVVEPFRLDVSEVTIV